MYHAHIHLPVLLSSVSLLPIRIILHFIFKFHKSIKITFVYDILYLSILFKFTLCMNSCHFSRNFPIDSLSQSFIQ